MTQTNDSTILPEPKRFGISLDILWFLVIFAGLLFFYSLIPLPPNDFWWHLKIGEYIYSNHVIPTTNMFAWSLPADQPFFYGAWLGELLLYVFYRLGGLYLIIFVRTLIIGAVIWLIASEARRRSGSWRIAALITLLLGLMIINNTTVRTQIWAWLPFITTYVVLKRYTERNLSWHWLILCPLSIAFWVNVHGSFILGLVLIGTFFLGELLLKLFRSGSSMSWTQIGILAGTGILSGLAILVNPRFLGIIDYTINLLTNPPSQELIMEWQSPTPVGVANVSFFASVIIFIIIFAYSKYKPSPTDIIIFIGFLWLAFSGQRYIIWYGMAVTPIMARLIKDLPIKTPVFIPQKNWLNLALAILLFIPAIAVQPWFVERIPLPEGYRKQVLQNSPAGPLLMPTTPVAAAEFLKSHPGGHLYNEMGYGSYLIWAVPEQGVFVDTRVELFPYDQWVDYKKINLGTNYDNLLAKYGVDRIILDKNIQAQLAELLPSDPLWKLEYDDQYSQIWTKDSLP